MAGHKAYVYESRNKSDCFTNLSTQTLKKQNLCNGFSIPTEDIRTDIHFNFKNV